MNVHAIKAIYRYPIKGLSPQPLQQARLEAGKTIPADRLYAIENGPSGFDPAAPSYFPKQRFLMLMRNERLAALRTDYDEASHTLTIHWEGREAARGDLRSREGRLAIEAFLRRFMPKELRGPPKVLSGADHSFSDVAKKVVSIINLASVSAVEDAACAPVNPLRFRGNLHVAGWPAWHGVLKSSFRDHHRVGRQPARPYRGASAEAERRRAWQMGAQRLARFGDQVNGGLAALIADRDDRRSQ